MKDGQGKELAHVTVTRRLSDAEMVGVLRGELVLAHAEQHQLRNMVNANAETITSLKAELIRKTAEIAELQKRLAPAPAGTGPQPPAEGA